MKLFNQYTKALFAGVVLLVAISGCKKEDVPNPTDPQKRIDLLQTANTPTDQWIKTNYNIPHNIEPIWLWTDIETDRTKNLVPPHVESVVPTLVILKHAFLDAYKDYMGLDFINTYVPRQLLLVGSYSYNTDGTYTLGQAEAGLKIVFFGVDDWDSNSRKAGFIHTMHHEFAHILHQTKLYSEEFQKVTPEGYTAQWFNGSDKEAYEQGFVSKYARANHNEDFVETLSYYLTRTPEEWNSILNGIDGTVAGQAAYDAAKGESKSDEEATAIANAVAAETASKARANINKKLNYVKDYLKTQWNYDLEGFRTVVNERMADVLTKWDEVMAKDAPDFVEKKDDTNTTTSSFQYIAPLGQMGCSYCQASNGK